MPAHRVSSVVLAAAVLCDLVFFSAPLRKADPWERRLQVGPREAPDRTGDQLAIRPACPVSNRDDLTESKTQRLLSSVGDRPPRAKRAPLRISRIGSHRLEKNTELTSVSRTELYQREDDTELVWNSGTGGHQPEDGTEPAETSRTREYQLEILTEPAGTSRTEEYQPEGGTEPAGINSTGEYQPVVSTKPAGTSRTDVDTAAVSEDLTDHLRYIRTQIQLVRQRLSQRLNTEMRSNGGGNSLVTLAVLALGVLLFDAINDALAAGGGGGRGRGAGGLWDQLLGPDLWRWAVAPDRWDQLLAELSAETEPRGREVLLPGPGLIGDYINSLLEIGLNIITVWMHGEAGTQCGRRLLCELNQRALQQSAVHSALTYTGGLLLSLLLPEAPASENLLAMRQGRRGADCITTFSRCQVTL